MMFRIAVMSLAVMLFCSPTFAASAKGKSEAAPPQINMTGTWEAGNAGFRAKLQQTGDRISGRRLVYDSPADAKPIPIRGGWSQGYLVLVIFNLDDPSTCNRDSFVGYSKGTVKLVEGKWISGVNPGMGDGITRTSAEGSGEIEYPYEKELRLCGDLLAYELSFDVNSDVLKGNEWPILAALAKILKSDQNLKIRVAGHTDSTGSPEANKTLSMKRAEAVKKKLVEKYGADKERILTEGLGPDQPLEDNGTPLGRAANRRVEISIAR